MVRFSGLLAALAFVGAVPGGILLAYWGHWQGYYPYVAVPLVFGGVIFAAVVVLFAALPKLRAREN